MRAGQEHVGPRVDPGRCGAGNGSADCRGRAGGGEPVGLLGRLEEGGRPVAAILQVHPDRARLDHRRHGCRDGVGGIAVPGFDVRGHR